MNNAKNQLKNIDDRSRLILTTPADPETSPNLGDETPRKPPSRLVIFLVGILAIAAGVFGYRYWQYTANHEQTNDATVAGNVYQVASRISGTVQTVEVEDNQSVKAGQPLVKLDSSDEQAKIEQATAALATAKEQAAAAQENIALSEQNTVAQNTQNQGSISDAQAGIQASVAQLKTRSQPMSIPNGLNGRSLLRFL